eukprot:3497109-Alexandrium_andersonii.AAC.1
MALPLCPMACVGLRPEREDGGQKLQHRWLAGEPGTAKSGLTGNALAKRISVWVTARSLFVPSGASCTNKMPQFLMM